MSYNPIGKVDKSVSMRAAVGKARGVKSMSDLPESFRSLVKTLKGREKTAVEWWTRHGLQHMALAWFVYGGRPVWRALKDEADEMRTETIPAFLYALERRCL
jgi:hypothetical protein